MSESSDIGISQLGLASILKQNQLKVPLNQREYSWTNQEVCTLLKDFAKAIASSDTASYFLGTIVAIPIKSGGLEVVDGQQRLATIAIMLSAIRDYLQESEPLIAKSIDSEFLNVIDRSSREHIPRLALSLVDNEYFRSRLIGDKPPPVPTLISHRLIDEAFSETQKQVESIVKSFDKKDHGDVLNTWITFMESRALAVLLRVSSEAKSYLMFETLNDRGLRTSQSDLVKNYLLGRSGNRTQEVHQKWAFMRGALETIEDDDITIIFLRHALTVIYGYLTEAEVYETVQNNAKASQQIVYFATQLESLASTYVSIYNSEHEKWNSYSDSTRNAIEVLNLFGIKPMRSLILATAEKIDKKEAEKIFKLLVSLCVRLMIASSTRTGSVQEGLANAAHKIYNGDIKTAAELKTSLETITPSDTKFKEAFKKETVSNHKLARYYLRSLEMEAKNEPEPWHIPNDDRNVINLEHVLPEKTEGNWPQFTEDEVKIYYRRIGNLALLKASDNSYLKSAAFSEKKETFKISPYILTSQISNVNDWTIKEISERQETLAELSIKAWPILP